MKLPISIRTVAFLCIIAGASWAAAGKDSDKPFKASKAINPIIIDGKLDATWKRTEAGSLGHYGRDEGASDRQNTTFRMLWDDENLYVFFECKDRFITARETARDGQPYLDDCAEIFLIPAPAKLDMHYGFELNLYKASNDFIFLTNFYEGKHTIIKSYNPDFQVEVSVDGTVNDNTDEDNGWTMELAIPLKLFVGIDSISPVSPGNRWAFQAIRQDRNDATGDRRSYSTLFPVAQRKTGVHEPEDFGFLEFVE